MSWACLEGVAGAGSAKLASGATVGIRQYVGEKRVLPWRSPNRVRHTRGPQYWRLREPQDALDKACPPCPYRFLSWGQRRNDGPALPSKGTDEEVNRGWRKTRSPRRLPAKPGTTVRARPFPEGRTQRFGIPRRCERYGHPMLRGRCRGCRRTWICIGSVSNFRRRLRLEQPKTFVRADVVLSIRSALERPMPKPGVCAFVADEGREAADVRVPAPVLPFGRIGRSKARVTRVRTNLEGGTDRPGLGYRTTEFALRDT